MIVNAWEPPGTLFWDRKGAGDNSRTWRVHLAAGTLLSWYRSQGLVLTWVPARNFRSQPWDDPGDVLYFPRVSRAKLVDGW